MLSVFPWPDERPGEFSVILSHGTASPSQHSTRRGKLQLFVCGRGQKKVAKYPRRAEEVSLPPMKEDQTNPGSERPKVQLGSVSDL